MFSPYIHLQSAARLFIQFAHLVVKGEKRSGRSISSRVSIFSPKTNHENLSISLILVNKQCQTFDGSCFSMLMRHCEIEFFWVLKCWLNKKKATERFNRKGIQKSELWDQCWCYSATHFLHVWLWNRHRFRPLKAFEESYVIMSCANKLALTFKVDLPSTHSITQMPGYF